MSFILADNASDDTLDIRDIIERFEELETELQSIHETAHDDGTCSSPFGDWLMAVTEGNAGQTDEFYDDVREFLILQEFLSGLAGYGGDEQWRGDWYPVSLIKDSYFVDAMQELVQDVGDLPRDIPTYLEINWEKTADNLRVDYSSVTLPGMDGEQNEFWYR